MQKENAKTRIAEIIRTSREREGLGLRELARLTEVSHAVVSKIEAGKCNLGPVVLGRILSVLPLSKEEQGELVNAALVVSPKMRGVTRMLQSTASTDFDSLCIALIRCHGHQVGVGPSDFHQGFGPKSGLCLKGYDLLIRLFVDDATEACWLGFGFAPDETWLALTQLDDYKTLPNPRADDFEARGGLRFSLAP
jgi:transcriptional regulator with XRE-family HTH domain